ncbi:MAG: hypothetical protein GEV08_07270 [Acidimicrobiia bacterium]|nr:hypothetical protein [Acidimicrobiia bacterium]
MPAAQAPHLLDTLKVVAALLRDAGVPFALGGGLAAWARGGPPTEKDIDLMLREDDTDLALEVLAGGGLRVERPPEGWLVKAYHGDVLVDLIYRPSGIHVDDRFLERCEELGVHAVRMPVMPVDDLIVTKLMALTEHNLDYGPVLEIARALREQVKWADVWDRTCSSPFARAFFALADELGIKQRTLGEGAAR